MKSTINNVYGWKENTNCVTVSKECKTIENEASKIFNELLDSFNEEQKHKYIAYEEFQNILHAEAMRNNFKEGFKLGLALAAESLLE
jgi:hypothetical protein